jgi:hypothetical protein
MENDLSNLKWLESIDLTTPNTLVNVAIPQFNIDDKWDFTKVTI